ncbi:MAG: 3-phosphoserine/phosphohydroxythreonine transaminase [Verrucomicrobia bacterium]|nr:3-phosphoserine/phosphohydroxythreonine transaminase [Verrucomicrobiota bacterium]MBU4246974.1 3-phosphoserine/phosphohydroxythreonine transaminase [Verrucomicrobiota bacterium]MBU4290510.1 3-phosphoserine/phosphohydroxythreonine transaminase [Verrucomicrobiota bacterium]MBU4427791.1 3-phosphoserine/phosphohydroxythreonine transaminase [Verrucomicrobiota bacterium]MCG2681291.1 3-phosphoserine/phosphohydroxythreonine transaminase [Kiritimatiellia bacterium]
MTRMYNFNAGPAVLPLEVLQEAQAELLDFKGSGMSILESSHRGKEYDAVHTEAVANFKKLLNCSDDYAVLFIAGGASLQFAMAPMNLIGAGQTADYINSGAWAGKAVKEAKLIGRVNVAADCGKEIPTRVPSERELQLTPGAAYVHLTSNETIAGAQWKNFPKTEAPLVADMSSDMLSRPFDINQFGLIYAGAQKNLGPSGIALVVIRKDLAERASEKVPAILKYKTFIEENSLYNTPPCFSIYIMMLVSRWLLKAGLPAVYQRNIDKAGKIYAAIDAGCFYKGTATRECRSDMNITFRLPSEALEEQFVKEASKLGMKGLKGHRSVGGIRASIYNAFPMEGIAALVAFMKDFEKKNG